MASALSGLVRRLFRGNGGDSTGAPMQYNGFTITPTFRRQGGQWLTAGIISKSDGQREHHFIRAETHGDRDQAAAFAVAKGKQIIDERGDSLFDKPG